MNPLVLYHADCTDGWCAAWILKKTFKDAELVSVKYDTGTPPEVAGRDVIVVDFSYPKEVARRMASQARSFVILDHHETAVKDLQGEPYFHFSEDQSGASLALWYVFEKTKSTWSPWIVEYVEDFDLWKWALPDSREVNATIRSYPRTMEAWDELCKRGLDKARSEGKAIVRAEEQAIDSLAKTAHRIRIDDTVLPAVCSSVYHSQTASYLLRLFPDDHVAAVYRRGPDGRWNVSLRGRRGGPTINELAEKMGGGGQKWAAAYIASEAPEYVGL